MEINGKVIQFLEPLTFNTQRGEMKKFGVIIETKEQFPKKICLYCFGEERWKNMGLVQGMFYNFALDASSREYNGRWYTEITCWKAVCTDSAPQTNVANPSVIQASNNRDVVYKEPTTSNAQESNNEDLPF